MEMAPGSQGTSKNTEEFAKRKHVSRNSSPLILYVLVDPLALRLPTPQVWVSKWRLELGKGMELGSLSVGNLYIAFFVGGFPTKKD